MVLKPGSSPFVSNVMSADVRFATPESEDQSRAVIGQRHKIISKRDGLDCTEIVKRNGGDGPL